MTDWLSENAWAVWFVAALVLGIAEVLSLDLVLAMLAAGAIAAGITAMVAPDLFWLQALVAIATSGLSLALLRPTLLRRVRSMPGYRSSLDAMVGRSGRVTKTVTASGGEVKVDGQEWSARSYDPHLTIAPDTEVDVFELDGTVALVHPRDLELEGF
ncbi:NfeD family protein [Propionibacteriaceae bacterium Y2011]|uniref:NfeD family protein n=1 Tax=Microlunatus sp. Y2014 TaxID=3418488 RepID=UPI003B489351